MSFVSLLDRLSTLVGDAFVQHGYAHTQGRVVVSARSDLAQFQCNGALACAKEAKKNPMEIAENIATTLRSHQMFAQIDVAKPGFLNITLTDAYLSHHMQEMAEDTHFGAYKTSQPLRVMIDYIGANVAKPLHVGHLRSTVIGEALYRMFTIAGHHVIRDVHLGDWGLQMGMLIAEIEARAISHRLSLAELESLYPEAAALCKADPVKMAAARAATEQLQSGYAPYRALWENFLEESVVAIRAILDRLDVHPDLWLGESDVQPLIPAMVEQMKQSGIAQESEGAWIVHVAHEGDKNTIPPLMLIKSDGAALYSTTDLATILDRQKHQLDVILYVVDQRQHLHFEQVFRAAQRSNISGAMKLEHIGFGTVNGKDGKPFKTREGGVMKLTDLIDKCVDAAQGSEMIGIAALKFADLASLRLSGYVFDAERFVATEGKTGPYIQYACVRVQSMMEKSTIAAGTIVIAEPEERALALVSARFASAMHEAIHAREPSIVCDYAYELAQAFSRFYTHCPIARAEVLEIARSRMGLSRLVYEQLTLCLYMLGINVPERM